MASEWQKNSSQCREKIIYIKYGGLAPRHVCGSPSYIESFIYSCACGIHRNRGLDPNLGMFQKYLQHWHKRQRCSSSPFWWLMGNGVSAHYSRHYQERELLYDPPMCLCLYVTQKVSKLYGLAIASGFSQRQFQIVPDSPRQSQIVPDCPRQSKIVQDSPRQSQIVPYSPRQSQIVPEIPRQSQIIPDSPRQSQ